jgi:ubiquinone/menaquinone biosynthesis C-methylase UbiE
MSSDIVLDIGCGSNPKGLVNIDAFPEERSQCWEEWDPKEVENFILSDANALPFREEVFDKVLCIHTLEHLPRPIEALNEMKKACRGTIEIITPSEYNMDKTKTHVYTWNPHTLRNLLEIVFDYVKTGYTYRSNILRRRGRFYKIFEIINIILSKICIRPEIYGYAR